MRTNSKATILEYLKESNELNRLISDCYPTNGDHQVRLCGTIYERYKIFASGVRRIMSNEDGCTIFDVGKPNNVTEMNNLSTDLSRSIGIARNLLVEQLNKIDQEKNNNSSNQLQEILSILNQLKIEKQALKLSHEKGISNLAVTFLKEMTGNVEELNQKINQYKSYNMPVAYRCRELDIEGQAREIKRLCVELRHSLEIDPPSKTCCGKRQTGLKMRKQRTGYKLARNRLGEIRFPYITWNTYSLITKSSLDDELHTIKRAHARFKLQLARDSSSGGVLNNNARPTS